MAAALEEDRFAGLREKLKGTMQNVIQSKRGNIKVGSICSGWGTQEMVSEAFHTTWNDLFPNHFISVSRHVFLNHLKSVALNCFLTRDILPSQFGRAFLYRPLSDFH